MSNRQGWATNGLEAVRTAWAVRSRRWWSRPPLLPVPDRAYLRWRAFTAYGDPDASIVSADLASFLSWRTGFRRYVRSIR
ncbi:MAG TPA: hypothetical protein VJQ79_06685 [Acidimicrobiia bacterium]|nr:hypothetical protein [Acidimicrobiia bacterium]